LREGERERERRGERRRSGRRKDGGREERREEGRSQWVNASHDKNVDSGSTEWNAESAQNLNFSEHMMKGTRFSSFQHEIHLISLIEAHTTIIEQDMTLRSKPKAKSIEIGLTPGNLKIWPQS
jgi:hypothetical protein